LYTGISDVTLTISIIVSRNRNAVRLGYGTVDINYMCIKRELRAEIHLLIAGITRIQRALEERRLFLGQPVAFS
jgi:hypothetical protein